MPYEQIGNNKAVCIADEVPFEIPNSWEWCRLETITYIVGSKVNQVKTKDIKKSGLYPVVSQSGHLIDGYSDCADKVVHDLPLVMFGDHTRNVKYIDFPFVIGADGTKFHKCIIIYPRFIYYWMEHTALHLRNRGYARHYTLLKSEVIPVPPLAEQQRIVAKYEELLLFIEEYTIKEQLTRGLNETFPDQLRKSILQYAVQGKLVPQDPDDEPASVLIDRIRAEKEQLIASGKIKRDKHGSFIYRRDNSHYEKIDGVEHCIDDEIPFEIPESWAWCRLGSVLQIARGGSPRPIKQYLTNDSGINWIKISDTDKGGKYIFSTKEKIIPEGVSKSRMVHSGDFLLTNSMSFGRPYILKTDGCIHDGWLVLSNIENCFDVDFLYYMLSTPFAYYQFCESVSGAVVKNLNSEKVAYSLFPIPPLAEQRRIILKIDELEHPIDSL